MPRIYSSLADLDELLLACRDQRAKDYMFEAIACFKASAYRASIVATWVAVCFDFIQKVQELALTGDKEAEQLAGEINDARVKQDLSWSLKFEKNILQFARDKFELISPIEFTDLMRVQEDRNRCAHPSIAADGEPFSPSAELARLHIRSAITHLLQHPPVQGKAALERLVDEVESDYFPTEFKKAAIAFANGPLKRPRQSLVSNFFVVLFKRIVNVETDWARRLRLTAAMKAMQTLNHSAFNSAIEEKLPKLIRGVRDDCLRYAVELLTEIPDLWPILEEDTQQRMKIYARNIPFDEIDVIEVLLEFSPLKKSAEARLASMSVDDLLKANWMIGPPPQVMHKYVDAYIKSKNFERANVLAKELRGCTPLLDRNLIEKIVIGAGANGEVSYSFGFPGLLVGIVRAQNILKDELEELLIENSLEQHVPINDE
jgi:hypothetical protein